jgi:hypothetical protein
MRPQEGYPPEVVADIVRVLEWIEAHPGGKWADMGDFLYAIYLKWQDIIRGTPSMLDGNGTQHTVDGLSSFGRIFLLRHRAEQQHAAGGQFQGVADGIAAQNSPESPPPANRPKWDRPSRQLKVGGETVEIATREAPAQFAVLDLLENTGWPIEGVPVPKTFPHSLKDAVEALNKRLQSTRLQILRQKNDTHLGWAITRS